MEVMIIGQGLKFNVDWASLPKRPLQFPTFVVKKPPQNATVHTEFGVTQETDVEEFLELFKHSRFTTPEQRDKLKELKEGKLELRPVEKVGLQVFIGGLDKTETCLTGQGLHVLVERE